MLALPYTEISFMKKRAYKKIISSLLTALFLCSILTSCKKTDKVEVPAPIHEEKVSAPLPKIDYDLSKMNYNMLSAITFEMLVEPQKYVNKSVKISGQFYTELYEGIRYYSVIVWDATLCCPAGMDFIPPQGYEFPGDFPEVEKTITVTGTMLENKDTGELYFKADKMEFEI